MKIALIALAKDEDHYIDEWIDYHLLLGFDDIFICRDNWNFMSSNMKKTNVHITDYTGDVSIPHNIKQNNFYNECINNTIIDDFDFVMILDVDEFVNLQIDKSIKDFAKNYCDVHCVALNWKVFGDSHQQKVVNGNYSCIYRFNHCTQQCHLATKTLYNLNLIKKNFIDANGKLNFKFGIHLPILTDAIKCCVPDKSYFYTVKDGIINTSPNINNIMIAIEKSKNIAYVNHYMCKTLEEYVHKYYRNQSSEWGRQHVKQYTTPEESFKFKTRGANFIVDESLQKRYDELKQNNAITMKFSTIGNGMKIYALGGGCWPFGDIPEQIRGNSMFRSFQATDSKVFMPLQLFNGNLENEFLHKDDNWKFVQVNDNVNGDYQQTLKQREKNSSFISNYLIHFCMLNVNNGWLIAHPQVWKQNPCNKHTFKPMFEEFNKNKYDLFYIIDFQRCGYELYQNEQLLEFEEYLKQNNYDFQNFVYIDVSNAKIKNRFDNCKIKHIINDVNNPLGYGHPDNPNDFRNTRCFIKKFYKEVC